MAPYLVEDTPDAIPLVPITAAGLDAWAKRQPASTGAWVHACGFGGGGGTLLRVPDRSGKAARVVVGTDEDGGLWRYGALAAMLAGGVYRLEEPLEPAAATELALGWALGTYVFDRYKASSRTFGSLVWPANADRARVEREVEAVFLARDLINTPANDMGPEELAEAARKLGRKHGAKTTVLVGDELLKQNYPTVHMVGRAAARPPRLVDLRWGAANRPKLTLVGKGVCFDTGGLDLKPAAGMKLMKKDMGGAACILGLAHMVMAAKLPVRLRVLVPAVENSVAGDAMRPLDIVRTRKGLTVEVGNTDAEGRLILCDALAEADSEAPDLVIDCSTLTGAARVALGPDLPALFCNDDALAESLARHGLAQQDPVWRMPLWPGYRKLLDSPVADLNNISDGPFAGAITAALFLERFVSAGTPWAHVDMIAWNGTGRPGRPAGGEAQFIRGAFAMLAERYGR